MTPEIYGAINERLGFPATAPDGLLTHVAGVEDTGMRFVDVWKSEEQFERFPSEELLPAMSEIDAEGAVSPPRVAQLALHGRWSR